MWKCFFEDCKYGLLDTVSFFGHKVTSAENYSQRLADWNPPFGTSGENIKLCKHSNTQYKTTRCNLKHRNMFY